jgi:hypothetical protein
LGIEDSPQQAAESFSPDDNPRTSPPSNQVRHFIKEMYFIKALSLMKKPEGAFPFP